MAINQPDYSLFDTTRLWVTLVRPSGTTDPDDPDSRFYVSPSQIIIENNTLILTQEVLPTDVIIITSMVPTASPGGSQFRINLNKFNTTQDSGSGWGNVWGEGWDSPTQTYTGEVHRENQQSRTYLVDTMPTTMQLSDQFTVANPERLVRTISRLGVTIVSSAGINYIDVIGVTSSQVTSVTVTIAATNVQIDDFVIEVINNNIIRLVFSTSPAGLSVNIVVAIGNTVMIQSEQIVFSNIDLITGVVSGLRRGTNTTIVNSVLYAGSSVYGVQSQDELTGYYDQNWYGNLINTIPLQITDTVPAQFLNTVV
jgi:hypothetical protein